MNIETQQWLESKEEIEQRLSDLARSKSRLELINRLLTSLTEVAGLDNMVQHILNILMQTIGAANISIIFNLDNSWSYRDIYGENRLFCEADNPDIAQVLTSGNPLQVGNAGMHTAYPGVPSGSVPVQNWIFPLISQDRKIGAVCMEGMQLNDSGIFDELLPFFVYAGVMLDNEISNYSQLSEAHRRLQDSEVLYRTLFEQSPDGIVLWSIPDLKVLQSNSAAQRLHGYSPEEFATLAVPDLEVALDPAEIARIRDALLRVGTAAFDSVHRTKTGELRHFFVSLKVIELSGQPVILDIHSDITERAIAQEARAKLESQLQQAQKMESVGRLAGGVAHDFNNMLTVILGHAQLGLMRLDPAHPVCADLKEISKTAERSADLTRQLLAFARKQTVAPKVIDLNETVTGMLKMLQRLIGEDIDLSWRPAAGLWPVKIDPSQIDQILANLCVNARDAIENTGQITIETANSSIDMEYCSANLEATPGDYVLLSVSDDGAGMDKETLTHIFEPFYTTKELGKGTGLGLATVYGAVKQNAGFINIYSETGQGTTFSIYLPRDVGSKISQTVTEGDNVTVPRGQETILLVEDEPAILSIVSVMLEKQGYTVLQAETPGEAIRLAREHIGEIQLLMSDVIMPEMNGRDLAKNIQSLYPNIRRLFMSGYTADVIAHHGVLDEGVHFIQKPFSLPSMAAVVREVLDGR